MPSSATSQFEHPTLRFSNLPKTITGHDLLTFLESKLGIKDSIFAIEIHTERKNWKPRDYGRIQFSSLEAKRKAQALSLMIKNKPLRLSESVDDIIVRPIEERHRMENCTLHVGFMVEDDALCVVESWESVRVWVMPERNRVEFWVKSGDECYKMEVMFDDVSDSVWCCLGDIDDAEGQQAKAILVKVKHAPRIYKKISGPGVTPKFRADNYHICKEDVNFLWVRTTDFSLAKSIGQSNSFCWQIEGPEMPKTFASLPLFREEKNFLYLEDGSEEFSSKSEIVPLVSSSELAYEVIFQLNSLVHTQKISLAAVDSEMIDFLRNLSVDTAIIVLQKLHQRKSSCHNPVSFLKLQLDVLKHSQSIPVSPYKKAMDNNLLTCHRVLITPSKVYCLGPELETYNYVLRNFAQYATDFVRVSFVEEDWSKLYANAISTFTERGIHATPRRTEIYDRMLSILKNGIVIGGKRFEFLAFSASQLRSNSVWMFASNERVKAKDIREWMGDFTKIRSVSKCAARMGQLFSSSTETSVVSVQDVEVIPDIEVNNDGIQHCFSDGIGKISRAFARRVAQKCGLDDTPSAFIIRYGGYKGVVAVDRNSFRKLSLRDSMRKFQSQNRMLNVTRWSESMPCYLNREIIVLLSTLGVKDEVFEAMQKDQLCLLEKMLTDREAALEALYGLVGFSYTNILVKMLLQGYKPDVEPYLSILLRVHYEAQITDLRSRSRIFVPQGRILLGALDETGILDYGQVYVCITMTETELQSGEQSFFKKVGERTSVLIGKVVVTKNPCLHPGDVRVLDAVYVPELEEKGLVDCLVFPQRGERPHPNECSGGDLDGDLFFISWDKNLIPSRTVPPMDYTARRPRIMDHDVTLKEIQEFFVDYMINDTLGAISTAHLVHADREQDKALSEKCQELARLHSNAVDFAKAGAPAAMPSYLKPKEYPDFMERWDRPMYISNAVLGKLYRATLTTTMQENSRLTWTEEIARAAYDSDLEVDGFESFLHRAEIHKNSYAEKLGALMDYYGAESEDEILTGNLRTRASYLQRDNRKYGDMKDRILLAVKNLQKEVKGWFDKDCRTDEKPRMASAWYHVTYHPNYYGNGINFLSFPWIVGDILLDIKSENSGKDDA